MNRKAVIQKIAEARNAMNNGKQALANDNLDEALNLIVIDDALKSPNLLTHLTSLTVAERETTLRATDMYFQTVAYDESLTDGDRIRWVVMTIASMETALRTPDLSHARPMG